MALSSSSHVSLCDAGIASIADAVTLAAPLSAHPAHKSSRPFTRLTLHGNAIRVIDAAPLAPFSGHLTHLDLSSNRLESMKGVGELRSLVRLNLASNRIRRIEDLGQLARLRWLELQFNKITLLDGLVALHGNAYTLEKLDLRCNPVQDEEELAYLAGLTKLRDLSFASGALQNYSSSRQHAPRPSAVTLVPSFRRIVFRLLPQLRSLDGADESGRRLEEADLNRLSPVYARPPGERGAWDGGEVDSYEKILQELEEGERMLGRKTTREQSRGFGPEPLSSYLPQHAPLYSPMLGNERSYAAPVQEAPRSYMSQHHTFPRRTPHPTTQNAPPGWPGNPSFLPPNPPSNPPPPPFPMPAPDNPPDPRLASLEHQLAELSNTLADRAAGHHSPPGLRAPRSTLGPTAQPPLDRIVVLERRLAGLLDALDPAGRGPSRPASPQTQMRPPRGSQPPVDRLSRLERRVTMLMDAIVSGGRRSRRASGDDSDASAGAGGDGEKPDEDDEARRFAEWKKRKLKEVNRTRRSGILEGTGSGPPGMVERDRDKPKRKEEQSKTTIRQAAPGPRSAPAAEPPGFAAAAPHEEGSSRRTTNRPPPSPKRTTATSSHPPPPRAPLPPPAPPPPDDTPRLLAMLAAEEERIHAMAAELQTLRLERDSAAKRVEELSRVAEEAKQRCITLDGELRTLREEAEGSRAAKARVLELEGRLKDIEGQLSVALEKSRDVEQRLRIENEAREKAERDNLDAKRGLEETKVSSHRL
ncbi:hypothetical protein M427DRAFT_234166 [Gonapodya prolifera JEL478]|uniref:Outer arm dynein light chain 1 n=1 Tax=Gonapodya prolifera (strain JEL478) TaxID=1344416 RepID=A0A139AMR3_GONPJ|nr:hypothetical protein M427DRAFT_234166 [Gonapodya prolifera JEL478]|eukprot:KXS17864.1 hypothetical protein M427DRAFT_234166 [Gonapodya prolifera JEL478]